MESKFQNLARGEVAVVAVPLPAQGHLNQLLHLSLTLLKHGLAVHFVCSATHNKQARDRIHGWETESIARIQFHDLPLPPFPTPDPDPTMGFPAHLQPAFEASEHLRHPLSSLLRQISTSSRRLIVVHDILMGFAGEDAVSLHNAEAYSFHPTPAFFNLACEWDRQVEPRREVLDLIIASVGEGCFTQDFLNFVSRQLKNNPNVKSGALINSCQAIEGEFIDLLAQQPYFRGATLFAIRPINPIVLKRESNIGQECLQWLDKQPKASVLYVSFGSTSTVSEAQIEQLAEALKHSGQRFIWVVRDADRGDIFAEGDTTTSRNSKLSANFDPQVERLGVVIRGWAPQLEILAHSSTRGFMNHCGWNSCMESMSMGVPILAWPMHSDQPRNTMFVTEFLKVGVTVREWARREKMVTSVEIEDSIKRVMVSDEGMEITRRAKELEEAIQRAASEGGSSRAELSSFIAHITR